METANITPAVSTLTHSSHPYYKDITNVLFVDAVVEKADANLTFTENASATGAGNGSNAPDWAADWSTPAN